MRYLRSAPQPRRVTLACAALAACATPAAQAQSATPAPQTIVITGNPLRNAITPASVLSGDALTQSRSGTLGDTLSGLPGVAATGFGPQSSRPVIRGLDGDRIRLLDNGNAAVDASSLSFDHAAAIDPLVVERFEVLRGPAALLYGGSATGGVVNAIDNRVPRSAITQPGGRAELRLGGAARERAAAAVLEAGADGLNWHADVAARRSSDLRVPRFTPPEGAARRRVVNSAGESQAGAIGASWTDADGHLGAAIDTYRNDYGVTVEPDVAIDMKRDRLQLSGERRLGGGLLERVEFSAGTTRYKHLEIEGSGEVGTTFKSRGSELRLQAEHAPWSLAAGQLRGVVGVQAESLDFSAIGEEAFVPGTHTRSGALFVLEEWKGPELSLGAGARVELVRVASDGDAPGAADPQFGPAAQRRFTPLSVSLGATLPLSSSLSLSLTVGHTERAPTYYELYANGLHVATGAFEVGDRALGVERSIHGEAAVQWRVGASHLKAGVFATHFSRYIALDATGNTIDEIDEQGELESFDEYAFRAVRARLVGLEVEAQTRLIDGARRLDLNGAFDLVRGSNRSSGEPLARMPPLRARIGLSASQGALTAAVTLRHLARQSRVPAGDVPTPSATLLDLNLAWRQAWGRGVEALWFARLDNATDARAFNAVALRNARALSPLPGRATSVGLRVAF